MATPPQKTWLENKQWSATAWRQSQRRIGQSQSVGWLITRRQCLPLQYNGRCVTSLGQWASSAPLGSVRLSSACLAGPGRAGPVRSSHGRGRTKITQSDAAAASSSSSRPHRHRDPAGRQMAQIDANIRQMHDKCYAHKRGWLGKLDWRTDAKPSHPIPSHLISQSACLSVCLSPDLSPSLLVPVCTSA